MPASPPLGLRSTKFEGLRKRNAGCGVATNTGAAKGATRAPRPRTSCPDSCAAPQCRARSAQARGGRGNCVACGDVLNIRSNENQQGSSMSVERGDAAFVAFEHVQKSYDGETLVVKDLNLDDRQGRVPDHARAVRLGQDHLPDDARRLRDRHPRRDPPRRPADQQHPAAQARHRHGVPELRALPAHDRRREPRLPAAGAQAPQGRHRRQGQARPRHGADGRASPAAARRSSPAASSSASRSPARWSSSPSSC